MNVHTVRLIQNPAGERVLARQAEDEGAKAYALHHAPHPNRARDAHDPRPFVMTQPRPSQPIWVTLPSSTSTGTVSWPPVASLSHARAYGSASTSYSSKSRLWHSSHSRISCVNGQPALP